MYKESSKEFTVQTRIVNTRCLLGASRLDRSGKTVKNLERGKEGQRVTERGSSKNSEKGKKWQARQKSGTYNLQG